MSERKRASEREGKEEKRESLARRVKRQQIPILGVCVVFVCVCMCERERERERKGESCLYLCLSVSVSLFVLYILSATITDS